MDAMAYMFSVTREDSSNVLEFKPECIMQEDLMSLSSKFPLIPGSQRAITFCTTTLSQKLREMPPDADFDLTDPCSPPPRYNVLHDPHLKEYFQNPAMRKRLIEKGFITPSGYVKCTLLEFNMFRQWIRKLKLDRIYQERRRQREIEIQQWKEKQAREQLLRDEELYNIVREREQKARELKERGIKRRNADRRKYLKLQEEDSKRREKFKEEIKRRKDMNENEREKNFAEKQAKKVKEEEKVRKIKIRLLVKRTSEDKRRESMLQKRRQTLIEEKEKKLKEAWKRRCSLSLVREEEKIRQEETEREEHIKNVARRTSIVAQQRRKSRAYHDKCLQRRRNTLEKQHQEAEQFLERIREKKLKDLELWKQKHQRMRERYSQQERRVSLQNKASVLGPEHKRRSSTWDLETSLKKEFGIDDNVVYSGVVYAGRTAAHGVRQGVDFETVAEEKTSRQVEETDQFEKLLSRLEAEFALRERVHYIVFGIISNAQDMLDVQERLEIGREIPGYVQRIVDAAQRILYGEQISDIDEANQVRKYILRVINNAAASVDGPGKLLSADEQMRQAAQDIVTDAVMKAKDEFQRRASLRDTAKDIVNTAINSAFQKVLAYGLDIAATKDTFAVAEDISENLCECAKDIVTAAIVSALRYNKDDREVVVARSLATDAVQTAKASLERLYGIKFELVVKEQVDTEEMLSCLDKCAKEMAATAIISASRSLERAIRKDDLNATAARSLALDAVTAAKASLEKLPGVFVELKDEKREPFIEISTCLMKSARDGAQAVFTSSTRLREPTTEKDILENRTAQSLASDAVQAAVASVEKLYGIKVDPEDESQQAAKKIAAAAVISATGSMGKKLKRSDVDLAVAARELASSTVDAVKASINWVHSGKVVSGSKQDVPRMFSSLEEAAKEIAKVAVDSATRSLERIAEKNEWDLSFTTRKLVVNVLDSAKASLERLYGIKIDPEVELLPSSQETSIISSSGSSLESIPNVKGHEEELMVAARNLASDAVKSAKTSLERLYCIANKMESNIKDTALGISKSLVDSSRNLLQQLENEGLEIAARELACSAIESAAKSISKLYEDDISLQDIVSSDSRLLKAAAKVSTISARASVGELFDRGFIGGVELEEATGYLATHALISAETMLEKAVQDSSATADLDLEIAKAAFELAFHAVVSAEGSVARLEKENQPGPSEPGFDHGTLFWKVTTYVEGLINGALRSIGSSGCYSDINDDLDEYEVITHDQAWKADAEYGLHIQDLYQGEILALKASRIVNDVLGKAMDIAKARGMNNSFFSVPDVRPGNVRFARRRSSSVHFNEETMLLSRRDSYVPRETDFLSVAKRPPTPRFRKDRTESVVSQEIQELENELAIPSDNDLNTLNVSDSDLIQRRLSDPGPGINSEDALLSEPERSASDSKITIGDQGTSLTEKASLYEIIRKREGTASCEISPCESYVVLPHLNPSECSLIAARVESYEVLWNQKKTTTSVTSLPSLSPKGSFVASEAVEQVCQRKESQSRTVPSSSRLPDITKSTSKISKGSSSVILLKRSPEHPKRTSSEHLKKSSPKPSPKTSKESAKLPSKSSVEKGSLGKATASSCTPNILSPGSSLTRASLSPRASTEKTTLSKPTSSQNQLKSSPKTSILFARVDPYTTISPSGPSSDETVKSPRISADKMSLTSHASTEKANLSPRVSKGNVMSSPRVSRERVVLSPKTSTGNVTPSPRAPTEKISLTLRAAKGKMTPSPRSSTENAVLSPSKGKIAQSPRTSTENAVLSSNVSKRKVTPSPRASTENAVLDPSKNKVTQSPRNASLSPRVSKGKITHFPRTSAENAVLSPRVSKGMVTQSPRTSTENVALSPRVSKEKVTQSPRTSTQEITVSSHSSKENVSISSRVASENNTASSRCTVNVASEVDQKDNKTSSRSIEEEKKTKLEHGCDLKVDQSQGNEIFERSLASVQFTSPRTDVFQQQGVGSELDRQDVYSDRTGGVSDEAKESEINKNLKSVVPSLERIIQEKRLTPEGAEAETRPASSADVLGSRKCAHPERLQRNVAIKQALSDSAKPSPSKSLSPAAESAVGGTISAPGSSRSSQEMPLSKASVEDKVITPRKKPEGEDTSEVHGAKNGFESESAKRKEEKKKLVGKTFDSSTPKITQVSDANQQLVPSPRDVKEIGGYHTYRKVSISRSIHDTVDDIVQRMLSTADEPSAVESSRLSGRGSREEMKRDSKMNFDAPRTFGRERRLPTSKVSKTVIDTVDFMLQSVSASDERRPRQTSGRTFSRSDDLDGHEAPRTASSMERFTRSTSSAHQGISCVYGLSPSPPKLPSPKRSRLTTSSSQDSLGIRATQSDSSIVSSSSNKAADLKPKVSGAWLDDVIAGGGDASVRSQSPKRPHSSPSPSLHRRSSGRLSMRHSLEGVSMETDSALGKAT